MQAPGPHLRPDFPLTPGLLVNRAQVAEATAYWGAAGDGGEPGLRLTNQASALVEVLARMDFAREKEVLLPLGSHLAQLVLQAQQAA